MNGLRGCWLGHLLTSNRGVRVLFLERFELILWNYAIDPIDLHSYITGDINAVLREDSGDGGANALHIATEILLASFVDFVDAARHRPMYDLMSVALCSSSVGFCLRFVNS